jgi:hypothetical protein
MKSIYIKIFILSCLLTPVVSCDYLDIVPDNVATIDYAFSNRNTAERFLYTCYNGRLAVGDLNADPAMGSDETMQRDAMGMPVTILGCSQIARGLQNVTTPLFDYIDDYYIAIRNCNIFLEKIPDVQVDMNEYERIRWTGEVKFLKAYYHFLLLRMYGPVPIMDVNMPLSASVDEVKVYREPVDVVVDYIVKTLEEALPDLPMAEDVIEGTQAGRADKLIALTLIADARLWAASPLVNSDDSYYSGIVDNRGTKLFPEKYDPNKWKLALDACAAAIDECHAQGKKLYNLIDPRTVSTPDVFQLQTTLRQVVTDRWNSELIWGGTKNDNTTLANYATPRLVAFATDGLLATYKTEWSPTIKMAEIFYSSNGVPIGEDRDWLANDWYSNRFQLRPEVSSDDEIYYVKSGEQTAYLHYNREPRFYACLGFDKGIYFGCGYYNFPSNVKHCNFFLQQVSGYYAIGFTCTGYAAKKMHHFTNSQDANAIGAREYFPFPIYRLADLYLMYAEACNEVEGPSGSNSARMFAYLDAIRERAGLEGVKEAWQKYSSIPDKPVRSKEDLREIIHRERTIELMFEAKRFWDIRRWREIDVLNVQPQGWNYQGKTPEEFYNVQQAYPYEVKFSVKDYFWPISQGDINVNENLVQNYGW